MKRLLLILSGVATIALVVFLFSPAPGPTGARETSRQDGLSARAAAPGDDRKDEDPAIERLRTDHAEAEDRARVLQDTLEEAQRAEAERTRRRRPFADPEMRRVMTQETEAGVKRQTAALLDAGLAAELNLGEERSAQFRALLEERGGIGFQQILIPMAAGELEGERLAAAGRRVREAYARNTAQIRGLLGPQGYAVYESYEKTQQDRETVKRLAPEFTQAGHELSAEQQSKLVALLTKERAGFAFDQDFTDPAKIDYEHFHELFNAENSERYFRETQRFHDQVAQRATTMLNPDQHKLLREMLATQIQRAKLTVKTTRAMMGQND